ncbi:MAG: NUDIX domain-containing protein [Candidatus Nanosalina sp.]
MASFYLAADALVERDGEYLMIQEGKEYVKGTWNIPGGGVEHGETPVEAVKREVFEETGLKVEEVEGLIGVFNSRSAEDGHPVLVLMFSSNVEDGEPEPEFDEEILDAEFLTEEEIQEKELRNDIVLRAIENKETGELLPPENFSSYLHPYMDGEPGE